MQEGRQKKSPIKQRILQYINFKSITKYTLYKDTGIARGVLDQETGISEENLQRFLDYAQDISPVWVITGEGPMLKDENSHSVTVPESTFSGQPKGKKPKLQDIITFNKAPNENVPIVDVYAAAGEGAHNADDLLVEDVISMPKSMIKGGVHHCIKIRGLSMFPTLQPGSFVINRLIDKALWPEIPDNKIYVITNTEGETFVKRVLNRFKGDGKIICRSDNTDKHLYPDFTLKANEITNIWEVEWYITTSLNDPTQVYDEKIEMLSKEIEEIKKYLTVLNHKRSF